MRLSTQRCTTPIAAVTPKFKLHNPQKTAAQAHPKGLLRGAPHPNPLAGFYIALIKEKLAFLASLRSQTTEKRTDTDIVPRVEAFQKPTGDPAELDGVMRSMLTIVGPVTGADRIFAVAVTSALCTLVSVARPVARSPLDKLIRNVHAAALNGANTSDGWLETELDPRGGSSTEERFGLRLECTKNGDKAEAEVRVSHVAADSPALGRLEARDLLLSIANPAEGSDLIIGKLSTKPIADVEKFLGDCKGKLRVRFVRLERKQNVSLEERELAHAAMKSLREMFSEARTALQTSPPTKDPAPFLSAVCDAAFGADWKKPDKFKERANGLVNSFRSLISSSSASTAAPSAAPSASPTASTTAEPPSASSSDASVTVVSFMSEIYTLLHDASGKVTQDLSVSDPVDAHSAPAGSGTKRTKESEADILVQRKHAQFLCVVNALVEGNDTPLARVMCDGDAPSAEKDRSRVDGIIVRGVAPSSVGPLDAAKSDGMILEVKKSIAVSVPSSSTSMSGGTVEADAGKTKLAAGMWDVLNQLVGRLSVCLELILAELIDRADRVTPADFNDAIRPMFPVVVTGEDFNSTVVMLVVMNPTFSIDDPKLPLQFTSGCISGLSEKVNNKKGSKEQPAAGAAEGAGSMCRWKVPSHIATQFWMSYIGLLVCEQRAGIDWKDPLRTTLFGGGTGGTDDSTGGDGGSKGGGGSGSASGDGGSGKGGGGDESKGGVIGQGEGEGESGREGTSSTHALRGSLCELVHAHRRRTIHRSSHSPRCHGGD